MPRKKTRKLPAKYTQHKLAYKPELQAWRELFGACVRNNRHALEWTIEETAKRIGLSHQRLSAIEKGQGWPSLPVALEICRELKMGMPRL